MNKLYKELQKELARAKDPIFRGRKVANNTYLHHDGLFDPPGTSPPPIMVKLHDTDVVTVWPDGSCKLDTGGPLRDNKGVCDF